MLTPAHLFRYLAYAPRLDTAEGPQVLTLRLLHGFEGLEEMFPGFKETFFGDAFLCLRPLWALADPLPDSDEVPAVAVARMVYHGLGAKLRRFPVQWAKVTADRCSDGTVDVRHAVVDSVDGPYHERLLTFYPNGDIQCPDGLPIPRAVWDYLDARHFALGLRDEDYHPLS